MTDQRSPTALARDNRILRTLLRRILKLQVLPEIMRDEAQAALDDQDNRSRNAPELREQDRQKGIAQIKSNARARREELEPIVAELWGKHMSLRQIADELNRQGIAAPRGGQWLAGSVRNFLPQTPKKGNQ